MAELLRSKMVTARKAHGCRTCNATAIQPGETYERQTYINDGTLYDWVQCGPCADLATEVWEWCLHPDDGIGQDEYVEWARDARGNPDARAFLTRCGIAAEPEN